MPLHRQSNRPPHAWLYRLHKNDQRNHNWLRVLWYTSAGVEHCGLGSNVVWCACMLHQQQGSTLSISLVMPMPLE